MTPGGVCPKHNVPLVLTNIGYACPSCIRELPKPA